jgi:hypothetical protein
MKNKTMIDRMNAEPADKVLSELEAKHRMTDSLMQSKQMEGLDATAQAKRAISHTLNTICESKERWELMGLGTQSFSLLTEAAATLWGKPVEELRKHFCEYERK